MAHILYLVLNFIILSATRDLSVKPAFCNPPNVLESVLQSPDWIQITYQLDFLSMVMRIDLDTY